MQGDLKDDIQTNVEPKLDALALELNAIKEPHDRHQFLSAVILQLLERTEGCFVEKLGAIEHAKYQYVKAVKG